MSTSRKILVLLFLAAQLLAPDLAQAQGRGGPGGGLGGGMGPGGFGGPGPAGPEPRFPGPRSLSAPEVARRAVERRETLPLWRGRLAPRRYRGFRCRHPGPGPADA